MFNSMPREISVQIFGIIPAAIPVRISTVSSGRLSEEVSEKYGRIFKKGF